MNKLAKIISACTAGAAAVGLGVCAFLLNSRDGVPTFDSETAAPPHTFPPATLAEVPDNWADSYDSLNTPNGLTGRARSLLRMNKDTAGWLTIEGTPVDYPVFLDPGNIPAGSQFYGEEAYEPNYFYLSHDMYGGYAREGSLYFDYRNRFGASDEDQSENLMIYGHNQLDLSMFGSLRNYRFNYDYYNGHEFMKLSSNYEDYDYVIFAFLITSGESANGNDFCYWNMEELDTENDFNFYVQRCIDKAMVDTGIDVKYGDKLVTLSTCVERHEDRFIIVGRRLRDGEVYGDMSTIRRTQKYIDAHKEDSSEKEENTKTE